MKKIVIVGGVAGGATLAARLRRISEDYEIIMFEKDEYIAFANCGLPYYIGGVIEDRDKLMVQTVDGMSKRYNLDIRNFSEVIAVDDIKKTVTVKNHQTQEEYVETYDELILSPGASPVVPPFSGLKEANNAFTLRNIPDTDRIKNYVDEKKPKNAVVIGGGFIGVEMAENLAHLGINVTLIDLSEHILKPFDLEMASKLELNLKNNGVNILVKTQVKDVRQNEVELACGTVIPTDLTILAIGVRPLSNLAVEIGIDVAKNGAIKVDNQFRTSKANIYALGDVIEIKNPILNNEMYIPLAWPANRQARVLADIISGVDTKYNGTLGASVLKINELTAAAVGLSEEFLKTTDIKYNSVIVTRGSRAGYYPGGANMDLKLVFEEKTGKVLGAQAIGTDKVEKRIDVIATAMKYGAVVSELADIEVCYAPPFNSAKDPVNIAGYAATNLVSGFASNFKYSDVETIIKSENKVLIDVRTPLEYELGHIEGAINIELDKVRDNIKQFDVYRDKEIYIYCKVGLRGYTAEKILNNNGFKNVYNLSGGFDVYNTYQKNQNTTKVVMKKKADEVSEESSMENIKTLDARGLQCPGPIMATAKKMEELAVGEKLQIQVTDSGFCEDIKSWCEKCGNELISINHKVGMYEILIQKSQTGVCKIDTVQNKDNGTIVMFSGDLDKALAAMIIAQGAAAMGKQMTVFFTFWGLNVLRKSGPVDVDKTNFEKMFGAMMPKGSEKLGLSQMNMGGMGSSMIKKRMADKNVPSLQEQIQNAQNAGVKFIACTMSMDLMGIKEEELIDGVELGGVAKYIGDSAGADLTLFI